MMVKPIRAVDLHYPMIQYLIIGITYIASAKRTEPNRNLAQRKPQGHSPEIELNIAVEMRNAIQGNDLIVKLSPP